LMILVSRRVWKLSPISLEYNQTMGGRGSFEGYLPDGE